MPTRRKTTVGIPKYPRSAERISRVSPPLLLPEPSSLPTLLFTLASLQPLSHRSSSQPVRYAKDGVQILDRKQMFVVAENQYYALGNRSVAM
jgi:hypothetical protein